MFALHAQKKGVAAGVKMKLRRITEIGTDNIVAPEAKFTISKLITLSHTHTHTHEQHATLLVRDGIVRIPKTFCLFL